jgi:hypothetical protein
MNTVREQQRIQMLTHGLRPLRTATGHAVHYGDANGHAAETLCDGTGASRGYRSYRVAPRDAEVTCKRCLKAFTKYIAEQHAAAIAEDVERAATATADDAATVDALNHIADTYSSTGTQVSDVELTKRDLARLAADGLVYFTRIDQLGFNGRTKPRLTATGQAIVRRAEYGALTSPEPTVTSMRADAIRVGDQFLTEFGRLLTVARIGVARRELFIGSRVKVATVVLHVDGEAMPWEFARTDRVTVARAS